MACGNGMPGTFPIIRDPGRFRLAETRGRATRGTARGAARGPPGDGGQGAAFTTTACPSGFRRECRPDA